MQKTPTIPKLVRVLSERIPTDRKASFADYKYTLFTTKVHAPSRE